MGVKYDVAEYFRHTFEERWDPITYVMFPEPGNDPVVERLITPKVALTAAEYLAFEKNMHILVILTDMTSFAERQCVRFLPRRVKFRPEKGYPAICIRELATIYERAGIVEGIDGSVTQIPILTMPTMISHTRSPT